jgi:hypothetical protein
MSTILNKEANTILDKFIPFQKRSYIQGQFPPIISGDWGRFLAFNLGQKKIEKLQNY